MLAEMKRLAEIRAKDALPKVRWTIVILMLALVITYAAKWSHDGFVSLGGLEAWNAPFEVEIRHRASQYGDDRYK